MKTAEEFGRAIDDMVWADELAAITARDAEHRTELDALRKSYEEANARGGEANERLQRQLREAEDANVMSAALVERLRGELAEATKRADALESLIDTERQVRKEAENTLFFVRKELAEARAKLDSAERHVRRYHWDAVYSILTGNIPNEAAREQLAMGAPAPAESTPVQVPIYEDGKRMDGPAATLSLKNPAAINRTTPGTTTCELCMQNDADRPAAFQCDGCAEYSCIEHAAAHRCLTTPAATPDDIRAFTPPLTAREWMMDHERRLAALEANGEPGTHAVGRPGWRTPHRFVPGMWPHANECREETRSPNNESCGLPSSDSIHKGAKP